MILRLKILVLITNAFWVVGNKKTKAAHLEQPFCKNTYVD
jgi:hypothetical protein